MNEFKIHRSDRKQNASDRNKGGGVALYVRIGIKTKIIIKSSENNHGILNAEFIFAECVLKTGLIGICVIYRTTNYNSESTFNLFKLIIEFSSKYNDFILVGDFNIDILKNINSVKTLSDHFSIVNHFYPTHKWPNSIPSLIDIAFVRNIKRIQSFSHYNLISSTHHDILLIASKSKIENTSKKKSYFSFNDYNKIDIEKLISEAKIINWDNFYEETNINAKAKILNDNYFELFKNNVVNVPKKKK